MQLLFQQKNNVHKRNNYISIKSRYLKRKQSKKFWVWKKKKTTMKQKLSQQTKEYKIFGRERKTNQISHKN